MNAVRLFSPEWGPPKRARGVRVGFALMVTVLVGGCGHDGTGPAPNDGPRGPRGVGFETLEGPFGGALTSMSQGFTFAAELGAIFEQNGGSISGRFALSGTLTSETLTAEMLRVEIRGTGDFTGTIDPGEDPHVTLTFVNECPGLSVRFSGTLESSTNLLTISGPVHILQDCTIILTFPSTIPMSRIVQPEGGLSLLRPEQDRALSS